MKRLDKTHLGAHKGCHIRCDTALNHATRPASSPRARRAPTHPSSKWPTSASSAACSKSCRNWKRRGNGSRRKSPGGHLRLAHHSIGYNFAVLRNGPGMPHDATGNADIGSYAPLYDFSVRNPAKFWALVWEFCGIRATGEFEPVLVDADQMPGARWFPNVQLNFAQNLLRFKDDKAALIFRNEWGHKREITYAQLHATVGRVAHALKKVGVVKGDRVAGFLPSLPETVIAMLATASLGAIWSSASPDFGVNGIVDRFGQIEPKVLFCADAYAYGGKRHDCLAKVREVLAAIPSIER